MNQMLTRYTKQVLSLKRPKELRELHVRQLSWGRKKKKLFKKKFYQ